MSTENKINSFERILNDITNTKINSETKRIIKKESSIDQTLEFEEEPFQVYVRLKPLLEHDLDYLSSHDLKLIQQYLEVEKNEIKITDPQTIDNFYGKKIKNFQYDGIFMEKHDNEYIFSQIIKNLIEKVLKGINSTIMAYGVTGTGKTHTMFGDIYNEINFEKGICTYSIDYLFNNIAKLKRESNIEIKVKVSYLEIYNEYIRDLLNECNVNQAYKSNNVDFNLGNTPIFKKDFESLMIVEDPQKGIVVPNLTEFEVKNSERLLELLVLGNKKRTMAATGSNQFSSRSHAIIQMIIEQIPSHDNNYKDEIIKSKYLIVDLAGSERGNSEKDKRIRLQEGSNINKSLLALGNCINILSDKSKSGCFVPYRDSKLTRLLKESLGGNISTIMISCISLLPSMYDETVNTLKYAARAKTIKKKVMKNVQEVDLHISQYKEIIESLKKEIIQLKSVLRYNNNNLGYTNSDEIKKNPSIKESLRISTKTEIKKRKSWDFKSKNIFKAEVKLIKSNSFSDKNTEKYLINCIKECYNDKLIKQNEFSFLFKDKKSKDNKVKSNESYIAKNYIEELLNINFNDVEFNQLKFDVETKLASVERYKQNIESRISNIFIEQGYFGNNKSQNLNEIQTNYFYVSSFYDNFLETLNDQLIENLEKNMIIKCNLKEIDELNEFNNRKITEIESKIEIMGVNTKELEEEKSNLADTIKSNCQYKFKIQELIELNEKTKEFIKELINKTNEITSNIRSQNYHLTLLKFENEKKDLENKNKFYISKIEELNNVIKSSQEREKELEKINSNLKNELQQKEFTIIKLYQRLKNNNKDNDMNEFDQNLNVVKDEDFSPKQTRYYNIYNTNNANLSNISNNINNPNIVGNKINRTNNFNLFIDLHSELNKTGSKKVTSKGSFVKNPISVNNISNHFGSCNFNLKKNLSKSKGKYNKDKLKKVNNEFVIKEDDNLSVSAVSQNNQNIEDIESYLNNSEIEFMKNVFNSSENKSSTASNFTESTKSIKKNEKLDNLKIFKTKSEKQERVKENSFSKNININEDKDKDKDKKPKKVISIDISLSNL